MANSELNMKLKTFPISFLSVALGLIGFTLAWQKAEETFNLPFLFSHSLLIFSAAVFLIIVFAYLAKIILFSQQVKSEFNHPIKMNFYPILAKVLLIMSIIMINIDNSISRYLWWAGVISESILGLIIISRWIQNDKLEIHHLNPAWFIPVVGCIIIPIAGVKHFSAELSWFFFSVGLFWYIILSTTIFYRIIFHHPIADKLIPTLFILFAPPVIGFIAITKLLGEVVPFGKILYYIGLFLFILMLMQYKLFMKLKFYLSWWAYSFPLAALTIGTFLMYNSTKSNTFYGLSLILFVLLNFMVPFLIVKTVSAIIKRQICLDEES